MANIKISVVQLKKIINLESNDFAKLLFVIRNGGKVPWNDDLSHLREVSLIKNIGGVAYANFEVNGQKPIEFTVNRRKSVEDVGSFIAVYRSLFKRLGDVLTLTGKDLGLLKKFSQVLSVSEFIRLINQYKKLNPGKFASVSSLWQQRHKLLVGCDNINNLEEFNYA